VVTLSSRTRDTGNIDWLCDLTDGSWVVIDYKSDPVTTPTDYASKAEVYAQSIVVYAKVAKQLVSLDVVGYLYFTKAGEFWKRKNNKKTEIIPECASNIVR